MKRFVNFSSITLLLILFLSSCASIIHGGDQNISINTTPSGAKIKVIDLNNNTEVGNFVSPCMVNLDRGCGFFKSGKYSLEVEKAGYSKKIIYIKGSADGWYIMGNFFIGGLLGWLVIDPATGAMWELRPERISISLTQEGPLKEMGYNNNIIILDKNNLTKDQLKALSAE